MESLRQANFSLPQSLLDELKRLVPHGEQSRVVGEAILKELKRKKLQLALNDTFGAWKSHKDLPSTQKLVRQLRKERKH